MKKEILIFIAVVVVGAGFAVGFSKFGAKADDPETVSQAAWQSFETYMEAARTHNLEGLSALSHQLSTACLNPESEAECFALMDSVYALASELDRAGFTHMEFDAKQIVTWTDGPGVAILYFTREGKSSPKVLGLQFCLEVAEGDPCVELELLKADSDSDGWWDKTEELFYPTEQGVATQ